MTAEPQVVGDEASGVPSVLQRFGGIEEKLLKVLELVEAVTSRYSRMEALAPEEMKSLITEYFEVVRQISADLSAEIGKNMHNISSKKNHTIAKTDLDLCTAQAMLALKQLEAMEEELLSS